MRRFVALLVLPLAICSANAGTPIFRSGFEPGTVGSPPEAILEFAGKDESVAPPNDWMADLLGHPKIGSFSMEYEGGETSDRFIRIIEDPTRPGNKVLHFWMKNPVAANNRKARIQASMYRFRQMTELYYKFRWYIPADLKLMERYPIATGWLTFIELWNDESWRNSPFPFRVPLNIAKDAGVGSKLYMTAHGHQKVGGHQKMSDKWVDYWVVRRRDLEIPIEKWMTVEYYVKEGDETTGRVYLAITPDGGTKIEVFALRARTHHPDDTTPNGIFGINPLKMYTSKGLMNFIRDNGGRLQWYYDDLEFWDGAPDTFDPEKVNWQKVAPEES